ncbi:MAG: endolytic transglycosylase MltG [candidate division Zixibacteria bacterium]|nr:endolytic transglycosylase MltG [candidate division Zixibacteria bacterium]
MSKVKKYIMLFTLLLVVGIISGCWWLFARHDIYPASIMVEHGDPFYKVVVKLDDREIVSTPWIFSKVGILIGIDKKIIPGRYDFNTRTSNYNVFRKLWKGDIAVLSITIPEGYNLKKISKLLHQKCGVNRQRYDSLVRDSQYLLTLGIDAGFAEGFLFPETYRFAWGVTAAEAIEAMSHQLFSRIDEPIRRRAGEMGYTINDMLNMASIIELEGCMPDEYPTIASVYRNRYDIGMRLQADPTVIYAMGGLDRKLMVKDYSFPSTYNTYLHKGLPPTPICSPGMDAIMATLYPASTEYLYFVADGRGRHVFNKTHKEHRKDVYRIKRGG